MKTTNFWLATIVSFAYCAGFVSQSAAESSFYAKAKEEGQVLLYTSLAASDTKAFHNLFEKEYPGVKLEIYRASNTTLLQKILTESSTGNEFADTVMSQDSALYVLKGKDLLAKFESAERAAFEARFKDKDGYWTDVFPTVHAIPYNTQLVAAADVPRHYTDLLDPKWKGRLGLNRNNYIFIAALFDFYGKEKGEEFLRKLAAQNPQVRSGGTLTATLVGAGELPIALPVNANNVENVKEKGSPVDWARIEDPLYASPSVASVMAHAAHPNAARLVVEFSLSKEGQELMAKVGKVPARSDVKPQIGIDRANLRIIPSEESAKTAYYQKMFDDLFGKSKK
jgi:iron(III) transport system substrate-binding protein